jgi:hypothetical protein
LESVPRNIYQQIIFALCASSLSANVREYMADPAQLSEVAGGYEVNRMVSFEGLNQISYTLSD